MAATLSGGGGENRSIKRAFFNVGGGESGGVRSGKRGKARGKRPRKNNSNSL